MARNPWKTYPNAMKADQAVKRLHKAGETSAYVGFDVAANKYIVVRPAKKRNSAASSARRAGKTFRSVRKHKKFMKGQGFSGDDIQFVRGAGKKSKKQKAAKKAAGKRNGRNKGYVVYPSGRGFDTWARARAAAKAESIKEGSARVERLSDEKTVAKYRGGRVEGGSQRNAGLFSKRKTKKSLKKRGIGGAAYSSLVKGKGGKLRLKGTLAKTHKYTSAGRVVPIEIRSKNPLGGLADLPLNQTVNTTLNKVPVRIKRTNSGITITKR
jgi:hypothetical protein